LMTASRLMVLDVNMKESPKTPEIMDWTD
jgi:hypothetical protein